MSHTYRPLASTAPTRRRRDKPATRSRLVFSAVAILASLASTVSASTTAFPSQITAPASLVLPSAPLSLDTQIPSAKGRFVAASHELRRRSESEDGEQSSGDSESKTSSREEEESTSFDRRPSTATERPNSKTASNDPVTPTPTSTVPLSTDLPKPWDDSLPTDFRAPNGDASCPDFIEGLFKDPTFKTCYPLSMLMEGSRSFFNAQKQITHIVQVLDASCLADVDFCTNYLNDKAEELKKRENCAEEFEVADGDTNAPIIQVYNGMKAYNAMYKATCLLNREQDMYCFALAVTNTTAFSDAYLYYLPFGNGLPGSSRPSCNQCVSESMDIFHNAASDRTQPVARTYEEAARQINTICGPGFVQAALPPPDSFGPRLSPPTLMTLVAIAAGALAHAL